MRTLLKTGLLTAALVMLAVATPAMQSDRVVVALTEPRVDARTSAHQSRRGTIARQSCRTPRRATLLHRVD